MTWIMVEKHKLTDVRIERERDNTAERTVTPSDMLLIFFVSVLRVQDGHVAIAEKIHHFTPFSRCKIACLSPANPISSSELHLERFVRFIVRHVGDRLRSKFLFRGKTQSANSGSSIEDDDLAVHAHFYTAGITSITKSRRSWQWKRTAHAPQFHTGRHRPRLRGGLCQGRSMRKFWQ